MSELVKEKIIVDLSLKMNNRRYFCKTKKEDKHIPVFPTVLHQMPAICDSGKDSQSKILFHF